MRRLSLARSRRGSACTPELAEVFLQLRIGLPNEMDVRSDALLRSLPPQA